MLSEAERAEHRALSERAWGRSSDRPLTPEEASRLQLLEHRRLEPEPEPEPRATGGDPSTGGADAAETPSDAPISSAGSAPVTARRRWLLPAAAVVGILCAAGIGWTAGAASRPAPAVPSEPPELQRPATDEDHLDIPQLPLDPSTFRFVASMEGKRIYLATGYQRTSVCLVIVDPVSGPLSGCGTWSPSRGGVSMEVGPGLTVAIGPLPDPPPDGEVFELSDTVLAIRTGDG